MPSRPASHACHHSSGTTTHHLSSPAGEVERGQRLASRGGFRRHVCHQQHLPGCTARGTQRHAARVKHTQVVHRTRPRARAAAPAHSREPTFEFPHSESCSTCGADGTHTPHAHTHTHTKNTHALTARAAHSGAAAAAQRGKQVATGRRRGRHARNDAPIFRTAHARGRPEAPPYNPSFALPLPALFRRGLFLGTLHKRPSLWGPPPRLAPQEALLISRPHTAVSLELR